jgi:pimeloyl-ACP methyl ester carboxylesterase
MTRRRRLTIFIGLATLVLVIGVIRSLARGLVYFPARDDGHTPPPAARGPREPACLNILFVSADGTRLHGWLAPYEGATRSVLLIHGNGGNLEQRGDHLCAIRAATRAHVFLFDYRGYGRSAGKPEEGGICADAEAALAALVRATRVSQLRTIAVGHSLGGAIAIDLARRTDLAGLVVASSFTSIDDMARHAVGIPGIGLLVPERYASIDKVGRIACPKLFLHGTKDDLIPFEQGERLFAAAAEPKRFLRAEGAGHDPFFAPTEAVVHAEIGSFVDAVAPETSR